ncbi:MAG: LpxA family transferase [Bacteroidetes bacterium]|nr:MAG: LpxA family transferase [Bacteroidota bacterium]
MIRIEAFIGAFVPSFPHHTQSAPWDLVRELPALIEAQIADLDDSYHVHNNIAIHSSARIEQGVTLKGPLIVGKEVFIGSHAYLRGGVFLADHVSVGPGCEVKTSLIFDHSAIAHFNFIGDSLIGSYVNFEAGSVIANHYNEREDKHIFVQWGGKRIATGSHKFGAIVGDHSRIGANAVLSPGTLLPPRSIVKRLELVEQL